MTIDEPQLQPIPVHSPLRMVMPFVVGITLGLCFAVTFTACQKQPKLIEDHSPISVPALISPVDVSTPSGDMTEEGIPLDQDSAQDTQANTQEPTLPTDSIENQLQEMSKPKVAPPSKVQAVIEKNLPVIAEPRTAPLVKKPAKPLPDEAKLHVPKQ